MPPIINKNNFKINKIHSIPNLDQNPNQNEIKNIGNNIKKINENNTIIKPSSIVKTKLKIKEIKSKPNEIKTRFVKPPIITIGDDNIVRTKINLKDVIEDNIIKKKNNLNDVIEDKIIRKINLKDVIKENNNITKIENLEHHKENNIETYSLNLNDLIKKDNSLKSKTKMIIKELKFKQQIDSNKKVRLIEKEKKFMPNSGFVKNKIKNFENIIKNLIHPE